MNRILFVDDEPRILSGLRRLLHNYRDRWEMHFAESGPAALKELAAGRFDVIVTDMAMPAMSGAELLAHAKQRQPDALRVVLSGFAEFPEVAQATRSAHLFLLKPCDSATLRELMDRACRVQELVEPLALRQLIGGAHVLPSPPELCVKLTALVSAPGASIRDVAALVESDVAATAKVLQLVNSAYFGLSRRITSAREAVVYLGMNVVRNLVLSSAILEAFSARVEVPGFSMEKFQRRAFAVARVAKAIASDTPISDDAFVSGLLHDAGLLVLAQALPEKLREALARSHEKKLPLHLAEKEVLSASHAEVGACLLAMWGFSFPVVDAVAHLHNPPMPGEHGTSLASTIALARALVDEQEGQDEGPFETVRLDPLRLEAMGIASDLPRWRAVAGQAAV